MIDDLVRYSNSYYNRGYSEVSDKEFDELLKIAGAVENQHPDWVREDSPVKNVGFSTESGEKIKHNTKMLSLANTYSKEELKEWFDKMRIEYGALDFVVEYKYDGVSFSAIYANGKIIRGLTRGDGEFGEDITRNLQNIEDLNISTEFSGEIRGELIMSKSEFERINVDGKYANPRNLTSGTIKFLDVEKFKERKLNAFVYWADMQTNNFTHSKNLDDLNIRYGFRVGKRYVVSNFNEMWDAVQEIESKKKDFQYEIDGAVIKVNHIGLWNEIGQTSKFPHWARAYKYEADTTITTVKNIEFWVGRTGKITPVAILEPVLLAGSTVQKATLNNKNYMENLDIQIGDKVDIKKAAEIIPFINHVIKDLRESDGETRTIVQFPSHCPDCNTKLAKINEDHQDCYCLNEDCPSRIIGKLVKYTTEMDIDGFAEIIVEKLYQAGLLTNIIDLYKLKNKKEELLSLERFGEKLVDKLLDNIKNSKNQKLEKFIAAIGIRNVGLNTSKQLVKKFKTLDKIMKATKDELKQVEDIADIVADSVIDYFEKNKNFIEEVSVILELEENFKQDTSDLLKGKSFCITGSLTRVRKEYEELIESNGGKNVSGVTSKTDYLVTNDQVTETKKLVTARELGISIITEKELSKILGIE